MAASSMQVVAVAVNWVVTSVNIDSRVLVVLMAVSLMQIGHRRCSPINTKSRVVVVVRWWRSNCRHRGQVGCHR